MSWSQRLKRVFRIDIETCVSCGCAARIIASIEDQEVIEMILANVQRSELAGPPGGRSQQPSPGRSHLGRVDSVRARFSVFTLPGKDASRLGWRAEVAMRPAGQTTVISREKEQLKSDSGWLMSVIRQRDRGNSAAGTHV